MMKIAFVAFFFLTFSIKFSSNHENNHENKGILIFNSNYMCFLCVKFYTYNYIYLFIQSCFSYEHNFNIKKNTYSYIAQVIN